MARMTRKCLQWWLTIGNEQTDSTEMMVPFWFMPVVNHTWDNNNKLKWPNREPFFSSVNNKHTKFKSKLSKCQCFQKMPWLCEFVSRAHREGNETGIRHYWWGPTTMTAQIAFGSPGSEGLHWMGRTWQNNTSYLDDQMMSLKKGWICQKTIMTNAGWFGWHPHSGHFQGFNPSR